MVTVAYTARTAEGDVVASSSQGKVALIKAAVSHVHLPPCLPASPTPSSAANPPPSLHGQNACDWALR